MTKEKQTIKREKATPPEIRFQQGYCSAAVFINKAEKDGKDIETRSVTLQKSYKDKNDDWQHTNSFSGNDLPKIIRVAEKAFDFLTTKAKI